MGGGMVGSFNLSFCCLSRISFMVLKKYLTFAIRSNFILCLVILVFFIWTILLKKSILDLGVLIAEYSLKS